MGNSQARHWERYCTLGAPCTDPNCSLLSEPCIALLIVALGVYRFGEAVMRALLDLRVLATFRTEALDKPV